MDAVNKLLKIRASPIDAINVRNGGHFRIHGGVSGKTRLGKHSVEQCLCIPLAFQRIVNGSSRRRLASLLRNFVHRAFVRKEPGFQHATCCVEVDRKRWVES
jgi:hypothetical protein